MPKLSSRYAILVFFSKLESLTIVSTVEVHRIYCEMNNGYANHSLDKYRV
jgi:hypothetical protein